MSLFVWYARRYGDFDGAIVDSPHFLERLHTFSNNLVATCPTIHFLLSP